MEPIQNQQIRLPDGSLIPRLGQGTWKMGEDDEKAEREIAGLRHGISLGMNLIDTAEMYGDGKAENIAGNAIRAFCREDLYLVSKIYPHNANKKHMFSSVERSLKLLGTDYLDLYLLHWRGECELAEAVELFEELKKQGKILRWGVSNFDLQDMKDLWQVPNGDRCQINQVLYNLASRGIEYDLVPWQRERGIPFMAYSPVGRAGDLTTEAGVDKSFVQTHPVVLELAARKKISVIQLLLAFSLLPQDMVSIPKAVSFSHVEENAAALSIRFSEEELRLLEQAFPAPTARVEMEKY